MFFLEEKEVLLAGSFEKYRRESHIAFLLTIKDADLVGGKLWDEALGRLLSRVLHTNKSPA